MPFPAQKILHPKLLRRAPDAPIGLSLVGETRVEHRDSGMLDRQDSANRTVDRMVLQCPMRSAVPV